MTNILRGTDEFTFTIATNMTSLVRNNFGIDDRFNRAWFVNPGDTASFSFLFEYNVFLTFPAHMQETDGMSL